MLAEGRPPRLVVDSSVSGVTSHTVLPNRSCNPTLTDVFSCMPLSDSLERLVALVLDSSRWPLILVSVSSQRNPCWSSVSGWTWPSPALPAAHSFIHRVLNARPLQMRARPLIVRLPDGRQLFFRNHFSRAELCGMFPWLSPDASVQSFISSWELLAQCALLLLLHQLLGHSHLPLHCSFRCDNSAAESSSWKGLSMASGLCSVLRAFFLCQQRSRISVHIDHVPSIVNDVADALSRSAGPVHLASSLTRNSRLTGLFFRNLRS